MSKKNPEQSENTEEELSIDDLEGVVGGVIEITTTDNQTIKWDIAKGVLDYNHLDGTTRTVKVSKIRRLDKDKG